jgi:hypothetical protein
MSVITRRSLTITKQIITKSNIKPSILKIRSLSTVNEDYQYDGSSVHFRKTATPHPLATEKDPKKAQQVFIRYDFIRMKNQCLSYFSLLCYNENNVLIISTNLILTV